MLMLESAYHYTSTILLFNYSHFPRRSCISHNLNLPRIRDWGADKRGDSDICRGCWSSSEEDETWSCWSSEVKDEHANLIKTSHKDANNQLDEKRDDRGTDVNDIPSSFPQKKRKERKYKKLLLADYVESNNSSIDKCLIVWVLITCAFGVTKGADTLPMCIQINL